MLPSNLQINCRPVLLLLLDSACTCVCVPPPLLQVLPSNFQIKGMHTILRDRLTSKNDFVFYSEWCPRSRAAAAAVTRPGAALPPLLPTQKRRR